MEKILVLDFGGQYNQLIARRVRDLHVYAEIEQYNAIPPEEIKSRGYKGIIFTGGPNSVYDIVLPSHRSQGPGAGRPHSGHLLRLPADGLDGLGGQRGITAETSRVRQDPAGPETNLDPSCSRTCPPRASYG